MPNKSLSNPLGGEVFFEDEKEAAPYFVKAEKTSSNPRGTEVLYETAGELRMDDYVPTLLQGTRYESRMKELKDVLYRQKEAGFDFAVQLDSGDLKWAINQFGEHAPEVVAEARRIADSQGLPVDTVIRNLKVFASEEEANRLYTSLLEVDPETKRLRYGNLLGWLADPVNMAVARDDVETLKELNILVKAQKGSFVSQVLHELGATTAFQIKSHLGGTVGALNENIWELVESLIAPPEGFIEAVKGSETLQKAEAFRFRVTDEMLQSIINSDVLDVEPLPKISGFRGYASRSLGHFPQYASVIAAEMVAPGSGILVIGSLIFGSTRDELIAQGVDERRATEAAFLDMTGQSGLEYIPYPLLVKVFSASNFWSCVAAAAATVVAEVGTETIQQPINLYALLWGSAMKEGRTDEEVMEIFLDRLPESLQQGFMEGLLIAPYAGAGVALKIPSVISNNMEVSRGLEYWDKLLEITEKSKVRERMPEAFAKHLDTTIEHSDAPTNIYISSDALKQAVGNNKEEIDKIAENLGVAGQMAEAEMLGVDLEINAARFATAYAGTELGVLLRDDMKFSQDGITANENKRNVKEMADIVEELKERRDELTEDVTIPDQVLAMREKLMASKKEGGFAVSAADADAMLSVFMEGAKQLSKQAGETTIEWFNRINPVLEVGGKVVEVPAEALKQIVVLEEFRPSQIGEGYIKKATEAFGVTDNARRGGFLMPGGLMLDMGEAVTGQIEHKRIVGPTGVGMNEFVEETGAIRMHKSAAGGIGFELRHPPTPAQLDTMRVASQEATTFAIDTVSPDRRRHLYSTFLDVVDKRRVNVALNEAVEAAQIGVLPMDEIFAKTEEGGSTWDPRIGEFVAPEGFAVGAVEGTFRTVKAGDEAGLDAAVKDVLREHPGFMVGTWKQEDGDYAVDPIMVVADRAEAERIAVANNQKAYYDFEAAESVAVPETLEQLEEGELRGIVTFGETQTLINLFDAANLSTFLHETSHIFVNDMKHLIDAGLGDEQLQADYDTLLAYVDGKIDKKGQEKIARAFEKYLREGKAPSVKLVEVFQRFKAWLSAIYKNLLGLDVSINDEVRQVFDRILAADRDIQEARNYYEAHKSLVDLLPVAEKKKVDLEKKRKKAKQSSLDILTAKYIKAYLDAIGGKSAINDRAAEIIDAQSVYKVLAEIVELKGLSTASVKENYGEAVVEGLKEKKLIKNKGGTSLGEMAAKHGFSSEGSLLDELLAARTRNEAITQLASEMLVEAEQNIREELARQEMAPGEEAFHNDAQLEYLVAEANILADEIEKLEGPAAEARRARRLEAKLYKDAAASIVNVRKVSQATRYDRFAAAEKKFDKQYQRAMSEEDLVAAYEAKKKQILNHALVQAAVKVRDIKLKNEAFFKPKKFKAALNSTENAFAEAATDMAFTFGLSQIKPASENKTINLRELDELLDDLTPEWITQKILPEGFKSYRDLSMGQFIELVQTIRSTIHYGRDLLSSMVDDQYKTIGAFVEGSVAKMDNLKDKNRSEEKVGDKILDTLDGLLAWETNTRFEFRRLDDYSFTRDKVFGPLERLLNRNVQAEAEYDDLKRSVFAKAESSWNAFYKARKRLEAKYGGEFFDIPGVPVTEAMKRIGRNRWTAERVIAFVFNMGNAKNKQAMANGYGYNDEQMDVVASQLTAKELDAVQNIWELTNSLFPQLDAVHFRVYNRHVVKEEAQGFVVETADGQIVTLKGGYYPLMFDHALSGKAAEFKEKDLMENRNTAVYRTTKPQDGMTYARKEGHSLPPELNLNVWFIHIDDTARNISHTEYMRDLNRITSDNSWRAKVQDKAGSEVYKKLREWVQFQARPERRVQSGWDRLLETGRRLSTIAILGAKVSVGIKQRLSMINAASEIGWKWIIEGYKNTDMKNSVFGLKSSEAYQKVLDMSGYMRARTKAIDRELSDFRSKMKPFVKTFTIQGKDFTWHDVQDFMFEFILLNDRATVGVVWNGAFAQYMEELVTPDMTQAQAIKNAITHADVIVETTQPSALPFDLNALQRSEGPMRLFTSFMTWMFKYGNRLVGKTRELRAGAITPRQYARFVLHEAVLAQWGALLISSFLVHGKLPEWWEWLSAPAEGAVSWIPIVRDVPRGIKYGVDVGTSPAFEGPNRIVKAGKTSWEWMMDDEEFSKVLWDVGRATELFVGVPALNVVNDINRVYNNIVEEK